MAAKKDRLMGKGEREIKREEKKLPGKKAETKSEGRFKDKGMTKKK